MYWRLFRDNRDFRLLYLGTLISRGGDWFLTVALLDLVLQLTGSATLASLILLCQTLPIFLFTPHAGHVIDRVDRRRLMIAVDVLRALACLLPLLARTPALLPFAYAGVILISIGSAYAEPAAQAALPNLVRDDDLGPANVLMGSTWGTMLAVGSALGGAVTMVLGRDASFVFDAVSFLLSAALLQRMRGAFAERRTGPAEARPPFLASMHEIVQFARGAPRVLALLTVKGGYGLGAGVVAMLGVFGREVFHAGAFGIGLLFAARGAGALLGPFFVRAAVGTDEARYRSVGPCILAFGAGYAALAISTTLAAGIVAIAFAHLGGGAAWQVSTYGLQRETPDHLRGRVFAADYGFVTLTMALSGLGSGIAADRFGATAATHCRDLSPVRRGLGGVDVETVARQRVSTAATRRYLTQPAVRCCSFHRPLPRQKPIAAETGPRSQYIIPAHFTVSPWSVAPASADSRPMAMYDAYMIMFVCVSHRSRAFSSSSSRNRHAWVYMAMKSAKIAAKPTP